MHGRRIIDAGKPFTFNNNRLNKNTAIKAVDISKQYRLGEVGTGTITHDLNRFWAKIRGKEDPYLKIGESNDRSKKGDSEYVWSLKDINFEIEKGDAVGIIGRNGAGKSTLLKLLSRVTQPTTGHFEVSGRIASLLEVGTGFNPEMTGRENIFLNGAILGMRRNEIKRKFDEIVDFAGVERYIDTPVKRYSSGMYVRLAFAVAAHLESEILIVDEVLAVGDAEFQKKCLGKMGDVSKGEGRTVLFVSHNMTAVEELCGKGILLKNGRLDYFSSANNAVSKYRVEQLLVKPLFEAITNSDIKSKIKRVEVHDEYGNLAGSISFGNKFFITIILDIKSPLRNPILSVRLTNSNGINVLTWRSNDYEESPLALKGNISEAVIELEINKLYLLNDIYEFSFGFADGKEILDLKNEIISIEILPQSLIGLNQITKEKSSNSIIYHEATWRVIY